MTNTFLGISLERPTLKPFDAMAEDDNAAIESRLDDVFPAQEKITIRTSAELIKLFKNKMRVSPPNFS